MEQWDWYHNMMPFCYLLGQTGFGAQVIAYDLYPNKELSDLLAYVELPELLKQSDIISLHCPLTPQTKHLINKETLALVKPGVVLINSSRGALVDTYAVIGALKNKQLGALGKGVNITRFHGFPSRLTFLSMPHDGCCDTVFRH